MDNTKPSHIALFTDFGNDGLYSGQMQLALAGADVPVVTLLSDAPTFSPRSSAYLLAALSRYQPEGVLFLCVVDPGVGSDRLPVVVKTERYWFVGPDNGLFSQVVRGNREVKIEAIRWLPEELSSSFHGRDLFARVAKKICHSESFLSTAISSEQIVGADWPKELAEIVYIDHYGNLISGLGAERVSKSSKFLINDIEVTYARTFSDVKVGQLFWYANSIGLIEIAVNQGSAVDQLNASIGNGVICRDSL